MNELDHLLDQIEQVYHASAVGPIRMEVADLRRERDKALADLAAARELLREAREPLDLPPWLGQYTPAAFLRMHSKHLRDTANHGNGLTRRTTLQPTSVAAYLDRIDSALARWKP